MKLNIKISRVSCDLMHLADDTTDSVTARWLSNNRQLSVTATCITRTRTMRRAGVTSIPKRILHRVHASIQKCKHKTQYIM